MNSDDLAKSVLHKIATKRKARDWSVYKLGDESGINTQTIHYWYKHDVVPSLQFIHDICVAFNITLGDFFAEGNMVDLTPDMKKRHDKLLCLSPKDLASVDSIINSLLNKNN